MFVVLSAAIFDRAQSWSLLRYVSIMVLAWWQSALIIDVEERDGDKMERMMTIPQIREAIKQSMVNLCAVDYAMRENILTGSCNWRYCATVNMAGIVFLNSQAGRTHEWYKLKKSTVQKFYVIPHILNMCIVLLFNCIDC